MPKRHNLHSAGPTISERRAEVQAVSHSKDVRTLGMEAKIGHDIEFGAYHVDLGMLLHEAGVHPELRERLEAKQRDHLDKSLKLK